MGTKYIANPATLGQKIRNRRLEKGLLQKDVAEQIGVTEDSITYWENGRARPSVSFYPAIIEFLGYFPFEVDMSSLGGKIRSYRYRRGMSQEDVARQLGVDESTICSYESGRSPQPGILKKLQTLLNAATVAPSH